MELTSEFKGRIYKYLQIKIGLRPYRKSWYKPPKCPYCGREGKFGVNLSRNRCNCFVCGNHPSLLGLVLYLENLETYAQAISFLSDSDYTDLTYKEEKVELRAKQEVYLPQGFKLLNQGTSMVAQGIRNYISKRGFNLDSLVERGWGYGTQGKYLGYLIIPFHENGKLVYFNARRVMGKGPKYSNPEVSTTGLGKSFIIYNKEALEICPKVFLCEGAINAQTMGEAGIASGGKNISAYQVNEILKSPVKRVVILFDPDAKMKAIELGLKLVGHKKVKVVFLPDNQDVNDIGKKTTLKLVYSTRYQDYNDLIKLKMKYEKRT